MLNFIAVATTILVEYIRVRVDGNVIIYGKPLGFAQLAFDFDAVRGLH